MCPAWIYCRTCCLLTHGVRLTTLQFLRPNTYTNLHEYNLSCTSLTLVGINIYKETCSEWKKKEYENDMLLKYCRYNTWIDIQTASGWQTGRDPRNASTTSSRVNKPCLVAQQQSSWALATNKLLDQWCFCKLILKIKYKTCNIIYSMMLYWIYSFHAVSSPAPQRFPLRNLDDY